MNIEDQFRAQLGPNYDHSAKPTVYFFDHAVRTSTPEEEKTSRPKFKNAVYISKQSKTAHGNQDFHRKMLDDDKAEFPGEWDHYLRVKENLKQPRISLLPGIDEAIRHEMQAVGIYNLGQLVVQDEFPEWLAIARRILDVTGKICEQKRTQVQSNNGQQAVGILAGHRSSARNQEKSIEEKSYQEKSVKKENITFEFEVAI